MHNDKHWMDLNAPSLTMGSFDWKGHDEKKKKRWWLELKEHIKESRCKSILKSLQLRTKCKKSIFTALFSMPVVPFNLFSNSVKSGLIVIADFAIPLWNTWLAWKNKSPCVKCLFYQKEFYNLKATEAHGIPKGCVTAWRRVPQA